MLAHEHAHLAARHHRWLPAAALVAEAMPLVPLLRDAPARVGRLLEMDADELRGPHEPRVIASALVAVTTAAARGRAGGSTVGAAGVGAIDAAAWRHRRGRLRRGRPGRVHRTAAARPRSPARSADPRRRRALTVAPLVLATAPAIVALLP